MMKPVRHIVTALLALAFVLGGVGNAVIAKSTGLITDGPCQVMTSMHALESKPAAPCKTIKVDCAKQAGCVVASALPMPHFVHQVYIQHAAVNYWLEPSDWANVAFVPDPLPPRTI